MNSNNILIIKVGSKTTNLQIKKIIVLKSINHKCPQ